MAKRKSSRRSFDQLSPLAIPELAKGGVECFTACGSIKTTDEVVLKAARDYKAFQFGIGTGEKKTYLRIALSEFARKNATTHHLHIDVATPAYFSSLPVVDGAAEAAEAADILNRIVGTKTKSGALARVRYSLERRIPVDAVRQSPLVKVRDFATVSEAFKMKVSGQKYQFEAGPVDEFEWELSKKGIVKASASIVREGHLSAEYLTAAYGTLRYRYSWLAYGGTENVADADVARV